MAEPIVKIPLAPRLPVMGITALVLVTEMWNGPLDQWEGNPAIHTPTPDLAELAGSWRLLSHGTTYTDTNERLEVFGSEPDGRMVLTPAGSRRSIFPETQHGAEISCDCSLSTVTA